jgi:pectin methylesterase-like acyl-CoA thioesterase
MKKKTGFFTGMLALSLAFGVLLAGCASSQELKAPEEQAVFLTDGNGTVTKYAGET